MNLGMSYMYFKQYHSQLNYTMAISVSLFTSAYTNSHIVHLVSLHCGRRHEKTIKIKHLAAGPSVLQDDSNLI